MIDRRLHVLQMVHQHGTIAAAAEVLHVTAPALSQQLSNLSHELGVALLERQGRRIRLTDAGLVLLRHTSALDAAWEAARADLAAYADPGNATGRLLMCGFPTAVSGLLAPAAALLRRTDPRLAVRVSETEVAAAYDALLRRDADIAVVAAIMDTPPMTDPRFDQQSLMDDPHDLLVSSGHRLAYREEVDLAETAAEPWIVAESGTGHVDQVIRVACSAAGFAPQVAHHAQEWNAVAALVAHGLGVSLLPRLAPVPSTLSVRRVPLSGVPPPHRRLLACVRRGSRDHPSIARGLRALQTIARNLAANPMLPTQA